MLQVKDLINDIIYAQGENEEELVRSWNENLEEKFDWIINSGDFFEGDKEYEQLKELFEETTEEVYGIDGIKDVINTLNEAYESQFIEGLDEEEKSLEWSNISNTQVSEKYYK
ncbi:hypothetical protein NH288_04850 [Anaerococcus sp. NML200537]|uniref:hypothetical protein n=1 Tax=Anaerococcus sp. NML200537 TaxID=2954485 RepID=UPI0022378D2B|nr:hypothetical protein [Anaerococcus sp. NML200537]MCW6701412.1 hypothetical protein [Anaerococcus sp. NML200537]